jgi:hypothetical protein
VVDLAAVVARNAAPKSVAATSASAVATNVVAAGKIAEAIAVIADNI